MFWVTVVIGLAFLFLSIVIHELAHYYTFVIVFGYSPRVRFFYEGIRHFGIEIAGINKLRGRIRKKDLYHVYLWGIVAGFFVLIPAVFINNYYWVLFPLYFFGCKDDLQGLLDNPPR